MAEFVMEKSPPLRGETRVQRAKNAVLPMMACAVLTDEELEIAEAPRLTDVEDMATLLRGLGVRVERAGNGLRLCGADLKNGAAEDDAAERMRASVLLLGPLLARLGRARLRFPGGCAIGSRPIDLHIKGLRAMGARFSPKTRIKVSARVWAPPESSRILPIMAPIPTNIATRLGIIVIADVDPSFAPSMKAS